MTNSDLLAAWERRKRPEIWLGSPPDGQRVFNLEQFLAAGPGPLEAHQRNYALALETIRAYLEKE